ncbi:hypothetical protein D3C74_424710 [compost metagenome]
MVMTFKEYAPDAALYTVRSNAEPNELTMTLGNRPINTEAKAIAITAPVIPKAQPSRF